MKKLRKMMALVIVAVMVLGTMAVPAMAEVPTEGSITVNSPIIGAQYSAYQIFNMTTNEAVDSFSYTISKTSPFYDVVKAYADTKTNGLKLTATSSDPNTFNVSVATTENPIDGYGTFDAQAFGKHIAERLATEYNGSDKITGATPKSPAYESGETTVTVAKADAITFEELPLGYYLITNQYPNTYNKEYSLAVPAYTDDDGTSHDAETIILTNESTDAQIKEAIDKYVASQTTKAAVEKHIDDNGLKVKKYGEGKESEWTNKDTLDIKNQLENSFRASAEAQMNKIHGDDADYNVKEPVLVFVDSSQPDAVINEKNEIDKWDEPINPAGSADVEGLPEHGEPHGGKNIVVREADDTTTPKTPAIYGDWTEANIGDSIHYQLSINATNFERTGTDASSVEQIKEYIIADYQNANMHYDTTKGIKVSIVKKNASGEIVDTIVDKADYSSWSDKFFLNKDGYTPSSDSDIFGDDKGGLVIPWIYEVIKGNNETDEAYKARLETIPNKFKTVETTNTPLLDVENNTVKDKAGNVVYQTIDHYFASLYPNDVTILVDYYMVLDDTAVIDGDGNKNISQYGVNFTDESDTSYDTPTPEDDKKPGKKHETDDAKVFTYALAIHKVDNENNDLAGAKFKIKGLTATKKADGWYKVSEYDSKAADFAAATELVTDEKGNLVIEGLMTSATLTIMETEAPSGFNKLEGTVETNATKISETVTTKATTTYYDADGNETGKETVSNTETKYYDANGTEVQAAVTGTSNDTAVTVQPNLKAVEFKVVNQKGTELPSTGGIGTTIFYVVGALLVLGAGVLLVTRRRARANEQ